MREPMFIWYLLWIRCHNWHFHSSQHTLLRVQQLMFPLLHCWRNEKMKSHPKDSIARVVIAVSIHPTLSRHPAHCLTLSPKFSLSLLMALHCAEFAFSTVWMQTPHCREKLERKDRCINECSSWQEVTEYERPIEDYEWFKEMKFGFHKRKIS
jgi:hypothetical protein